MRGFSWRSITIKTDDCPKESEKCAEIEEEEDVTCNSTDSEDVDHGARYENNRNFELADDSVSLIVRKLCFRRTVRISKKFF